MKSGRRLLDDFDPLDVRFAPVIFNVAADAIPRESTRKIIVESAHRVLEQKLEGLKAITHVGVQKAVRACQELILLLGPCYPLLLGAESGLGLLLPTAGS